MYHELAIMPKTLSLKETADLLGISTATVLNWQRHGYLNPLKYGQKKLYKVEEIIDTKNRIDNGQIDRLNSRANKKNSGKTFLPQEYFHDATDLFLINEILHTIQRNNIDPESGLFLIAMNRLIKTGLIDSCTIDDIYKNIYVTPNLFLRADIDQWLLNPEISKPAPGKDHLLSMKIPMEGDLLGVIYQSLLTEGHKSKEGSYYTPQRLADKMAAEYIIPDKNYKVLDPCCGTGQFLLSAAGIIRELQPDYNPQNIWGYDIDPLAVKIARINLYLKFPEKQFSPNIYTRNIIFHFTLGKKSGLEKDFDLILGNPPWGADLKFEQTNFLKDHYPIIASFESFSYFIYIALYLLKENGILSYILPEAIINIKTHKDIRSYILRNSHILKIEHLGRVFRNVYTPVIRLDLKKSFDQSTGSMVFLPGQSFSIDSNRFSHNQDKIFDIFNTNDDEQIINKLFAFPHTTLQDKADWALGIVTGNNEKFISDTKKEGYEPIYKGRDVEKFYLKEPGAYILFKTELFQQTAPVAKYRVSEKLIYRFISNKLVFAYDNQQRLTLNSANILIPTDDQYPVKLISALFNSSLYQFVFLKKFFTHKILKNHLEGLPLLILDGSMQKAILDITDSLINPALPEKQRIRLLSELDGLLFELLKLRSNEIDCVKKAVG
jgi:type I restriction-modification system DNA methylase subunit